MTNPTEEKKKIEEEIERILKKKIDKATPEELAEAGGFLEGFKLGKEQREKELKLIAELPEEIICPECGAKAFLINGYYYCNEHENTSQRMPIGYILQRYREQILEIIDNISAYEKKEGIMKKILKKLESF